MAVDFPHSLVVRQGPFRWLEAESQSSKPVYRLYGKYLGTHLKIICKFTESIEYSVDMRCLKVVNIAQEVLEDE